MERSAWKRTDAPNWHLMSCLLGVPVENDLAEFPPRCQSMRRSRVCYDRFENGSRVAVAVPGLSNGFIENVTTAEKGLSP